MNNKLTSFRIIIARGVCFVMLLSSVICVTSGCATARGSYVLTGQARSPLSSDMVRIYTTPPAKYEVIGTVRASSESGLTKDGCLEYAKKELCKQAAKMGANGILIENANKGSYMMGGLVGGIPLVVPGLPRANIIGKAIYVSD